MNGNSFNTFYVGARKTKAKSTLCILVTFSRQLYSYATGMKSFFLEIWGDAVGRTGGKFKCQNHSRDLPPEVILHT
jgi:hypothetical protein